VKKTVTQKFKAFRRALRIFRNERGDTMVTAVIAAGVVGMAAAGTAGIVKLMHKESTFSNTNAASLSIESTILLALQSPDTYPPEIARFMRGGGEDIVKNVEIRDDRGVIARIGGTVNLDSSGRACSPKADKPCAMTTSVRIDCGRGAVCRAAYQIAFPKPAAFDSDRKPSDVSANSAMAPLGSAVWPPRPNTSDFSTILSYDLFRREEGKNTCAPNELFVSGVDKSNGNVSCVLPSQAEIEKNQIGQTMEYNSVTRSLEVVPRTLGRASCPKDYVLQSLDPSSLDEGRSPQGICVYRYKKELPWMETWPRGQASVSGPVCPQKDYAVVPNGTCKVNVTARHVGTGCRYPASPRITYKLSQQYDSNGPNVSCSFVKTGRQNCGADWDGEVVWSGSCKLTVPETVPATGGAQ